MDHNPAIDSGYDQQICPELQYLRFAQLSAPRQALIRWFQTINFGGVHNFEVRDAQPVFSSATQVLIDVKLDSSEDARPELKLADFNLSNEVRRLLTLLDDIGHGVIRSVEVRSGIPRRVVFRAAMQETLVEPCRPEAGDSRDGVIEPGNGEGSKP